MMFRSLKIYVLDAILLAFLLGGVLSFFLPKIDEENFRVGLALGLTMLFMGIGMLTSFVLQKQQTKTVGLLVFEKHPAPGEVKKAWYQTFWGWQLTLSLVLALVISVQVTRVNLIELLDATAFWRAMAIFRDMLRPVVQIFTQGHFAPIYKDGVLKMVETIFIAFLATVVAIPIAFTLSFMAAKNIMGKSTATLTVYVLLRALFNIARSIEPIIWAIIFAVWVGIGPFAGMLSLLIHSVASLSKLYSEQIESVEEGPIEGIQSTGASTLQTIWFGIVPQVVLPFVGYTIYRWDINVRMATIIGLVGGGGIGQLLFNSIQSGKWEEVGALALIITIVVWAMDTASAYIREALK